MRRVLYRPLTPPRSWRLPRPHSSTPGNDEDPESAADLVSGYVVLDAAPAGLELAVAAGLDDELRAHGITGICDHPTRAADPAPARTWRCWPASPPAPRTGLLRERSLGRPQMIAPTLARWCHGGRLHGFPPDRGRRSVTSPRVDLGIKTPRRSHGPAGCPFTVLPAASTTEDSSLLAGWRFLLQRARRPGLRPVYRGPVPRRACLSASRSFGICLGSQVALRALGPCPYKLRFGTAGKPPFKYIATGGCTSPATTMALRWPYRRRVTAGPGSTA